MPLCVSQVGSHRPQMCIFPTQAFNKSFVYFHKAVSFTELMLQLSHCQENWNSGKVSSLPTSQIQPPPFLQLRMQLCHFYGKIWTIVIGKAWVLMLTVMCNGVLNFFYLMGCIGGLPLLIKYGRWPTMCNGGFSLLSIPLVLSCQYWWSASRPIPCLVDVILLLTAVIVVESYGRSSQPSVDFALFLKPFLTLRKLRTSIGIMDADLDMFGTWDQCWLIVRDKLVR